MGSYRSSYEIFPRKQVKNIYSNLWQPVFRFPTSCSSYFASPPLPLTTPSPPPGPLAMYGADLVSYLFSIIQTFFSQYFIFFRGRFFFLFVFFYLNLSFLLAGNQPWRLFFGQLVVIFVDNQERLSPRIRILLPGQFLIPATAFVSIYTLVLMALDRCVFSSEKHNLWLFKSLKRRFF